MKSPKIFKQLNKANFIDNKNALSKEKNLTSSRAKIISHYTDKSYKKNVLDNNYIFHNINSFSKQSNTSKKKKVIFDTKNKNKSKNNIFNKKLLISKNEISNIINQNINNTNNTKQGMNISITSVKSESEEKTKYEELYNNILSYELILPFKCDKIQLINKKKQKLTINRNILSPQNDRLPYNDKFPIKKNVKDIKNNNNATNKKLIKVNLNANDKKKKNIKKDASYAISNSNTNSNTNSRNITNYFNDNKVNKNTYLDVSNFNKDINQIINIKESIAILKEQLKGDNNKYDFENDNKVKSKKNKKIIKKYQNKAITRNKIRNNDIYTFQTLQKTEITNNDYNPISTNIKINKNNINKNKNKNHIHMRQNRTKSNLINILHISKDSRNSSLSKNKNLHIQSHNNTCKNFFIERKNFLPYIKNNSSKNILITKNNQNICSQKLYLGIKNKNSSKIFKYIKKNDIDLKYNSALLSKKKLENKMKSLNRNKTLNITENIISSDINKKNKNKNKNNNKNIKKFVLENIIKNKNNIPISNSINNSILNDSIIKNKNIVKYKNKLKFIFFQNTRNLSFDMKLITEQNPITFYSNKSQMLPPIYRKKYKKENSKEIMKNIGKIEIISKPGETIHGKTKINQDNYFCYDLIEDFKFIGVCDGHGEYGHNVSEFIKNNLPRELNNQLKKTYLYDKILKSFDETLNKNIDYKKIKEILNKSHIILNNKLLLKHNIINCDLNFSGSTCINILFDKKKLNRLYISNVGDSRAIIIKEMKNKYWTCQQLSRYHKPIEKDESSRIYKNGGEIQKIRDENGGWIGPLRVWEKNGDGPGLAMTRSFGDIIGSSIGVICSPEINEYIIKKEDKAIIIASDGLWEYISNKEVTNIVKNSFKKENNKIVEKLYKEAYKNWKTKDKVVDDITIICIVLKRI